MTSEQQEIKKDFHLPTDKKDWNVIYVVENKELMAMIKDFAYTTILELIDKKQVAELKKKCIGILSDEDEKEIFESNKTNWSLIELFEEQQRVCYILDGYRIALENMRRFYTVIEKNNIFSAASLSNVILADMKKNMPHKVQALKELIEMLQPYKGMSSLNGTDLYFLPDSMEMNEKNVRIIDVKDILNHLDDDLKSK